MNACHILREREREREAVNMFNVNLVLCFVVWSCGAFSGPSSNLLSVKTDTVLPEVGPLFSVIRVNLAHALYAKANTEYRIQDLYCL